MNQAKLTMAGINYAQGVDRFAGNAAMYERFLGKLFAAQEMAQLERQLTDKDYEAAFATAHSLKGNAGNLSVNEFYRLISEVTDEVRHGKPGPDLMQKFEAAQCAFEKARASVAEETAGPTKE